MCYLYVIVLFKLSMHFFLLFIFIKNANNSDTAFKIARETPHGVKEAYIYGSHLGIK